MKRPIGIESVYYHKMNPKNQAILKKFREEFNSKILDVEWSSKRRRLEELGKIYLACKDSKKFPAAINALKEMREEVEGKKGQGNTVLIQNNYTSLTDEEIDKKRLELIELVQKHKVMEGVNQPEAEDDGENNTLTFEMPENA